MVRSPIYFLNLIIIVPLLPVIMMASLFFSLGSSGNSFDTTDILNLLAVGGSGMERAQTFLIALAIMIFFCSVSMISSTAISRMGNNAFIAKYIPVTPLVQLRAKMFWGIFLSSFLVVVLIGFFVVTSVFSILDGVILLIPSIAVLYLLNYAGLFVDLKRPKLNWTTESSAVKTNVNSLVVMLASWVLGGLLLAAAFLLKLDTIAYSGYYIAALVTLLAIIATRVLYRYYSKGSATVFSTF